MTLDERDWFSPCSEAVTGDRRLYAVVHDERTAGELRALLDLAAFLAAVADTLPYPHDREARELLARQDG